MINIEIVRSALGQTAEKAASRGMPRATVRGQLIRPSLAYAAASASNKTIGPRFWEGALAIQLAHEASLIHDDIVDESPTRRGEASLAQTHGVAKALVLGDHLLTASYRLASETLSIEFVSLFSRCVERTVAGEIEQTRSLGKTLTFSEYRAIAEAKSGELIAASLALSAALDDPVRIETRALLGRELGLLYQMLDDLLDYCPETDTGKPALGDFAQKRWTWPLLELGSVSFNESPDVILRRFHSRREAQTPLRACLARLSADARALKAKLAAEFGEADVGRSLIDDWVARARRAVAKEEQNSRHASASASRESDSVRSHIPVRGNVVAFLSANSKSFRFASRFFPRKDLDRIAHVYAFCRITDDLVDLNDPVIAERYLDEWMHLARRSYDGVPSGIAFLDRTMSEMRSNLVPFRYASDLADGMRMDLCGEKYSTLADLRTYTYRVASVVGVWLAELAGVRDGATLRHAEAMGHAMQLTNILRDVGEDARRGRVYLPTSRLEAHGLTRDAIISAARDGGGVPDGFDLLVEELLCVAERDYEFALEGVHALPPSFRKAVAVAAHVYRGIHSEIRRNGYDSLHRRAVTPTRAKIALATKALWRLQAAPVPVLQTA